MRGSAGRTPARRGQVRRHRRGEVENADYAAFAGRVIRAHARRIADGDVDGLADLLTLRDELDAVTQVAVTGLRGFGYSWGEIAGRLGTTRQAAQQRWRGETFSSRGHQPWLGLRLSKVSVLLARYRRWLRLPASVVPGSIFMALLAGVTALVFVVGGVVGGLIANDYPRGGRLIGLVLAGCGAFGLVMAYRTLRGKASVRELVALTTLWASTGWVDRWINDTPKPRVRWVTRGGR